MTIDPDPTRGFTPRRDEIGPIPHPLGFASPDTASTFDNSPGMDAAIEVAGIQFLSAAGEEHPHQRRLRSPAKEQVDTSPYPGDQSLSDWWLRTQTDFSGGAGQQFMEPITEDGVNRRFLASAGVDPFTIPGQVSLLPESVELDTALPSPGPVRETLARFNGGFVSAGGTTVRSYSWSAGTTPIRGNEQAAGDDVEHLTVAGNVLLLSMQGRVQTMPLDASTAPIDRYTGAGTRTPVCAHVKNRTLVMAGDRVWEVPGNADVNLDMATATPIIDLHDPSWEWVGAANTPTSILLAGNGAGTGAVMSLTVDPQSGNLPTLAAPSIVAELPPGEQIVSIATYLGAFAVLATTAGVRVGTLNANSGLQYGPLLGAPPMIEGGAGFSMWDRFAQYPVADAGDNRGGLVRIDLSELDRDSRAPWATFTRIPPEKPVHAHVMLDGANVVMLDEDGQLWHSSPSGLLDSGWLETSLTRYGTLEPKNFSTVRVVALPAIAGVLTTSTIVEGRLGPKIGALTKSTGPEGTFPTGNRRALSQMGLRFDFERDTAFGGTGPVLEAWSMKSLPAITDEGELVTLALLNFDFERTPRGGSVGHEGLAWERWRALTARIALGGDIQVKELNSGATYLATPVDCLFTQVAAGNRASGFGGIIDLQVREVR